MTEMAPVEAESAPNGTDSEEKPVREQFKKASIAGTNGESNIITAEDKEQPEQSGGSAEDGQIPTKAASIDDVGNGESSPEPTRQHTRKRSRDSTVDELDPDESRKRSSESTREKPDAADPSEMPNGRSSFTKERRAGSPEPSEDLPEDVASPKTKRSRLLSSSAEETTLTADPSSTNSSTITSPSSKAVPEATTATPSDLTTGTGDKAPLQTTSNSAFAASGFSALAKSTVSGFVAIGKSSNGIGVESSFTSSPKAPGATNTLSPKVSESTSAFGGPLPSKSGFASTPSTGTGFGSSASGFAALGKGGSAFGSTGSGFGGLSGGGLTSFASGKPSPFGSTLKPSRPFGARVAEENDEDEDGNDEEADGVKSPLAQEDERQDERFFEQEIETGEENEDTRYTCRAKLYNFANIGEGKKEWKERGLGTLRLNVSRLSAGDESKTKARLVMRADGSHRVVLNTPVTKDIKFGSPTGGPPTGIYLLFMGTITSALEPLQLKMKAQFALELYDSIIKLQAEM